MEIENIVASLSIKRIPDPSIIKHIQNTTGHSITSMTLWNIRQRLKKESYKWNKTLRDGEYDYLYEFRERINKIVDLQRRHYEIVEDNASNPGIQQVSLAALHKLNVTLSSYFNILPSLSHGDSNQTSQTSN